MSEAEETTIRFEKSKNQVAKEKGYKDWETCINDQPNHMVEQVMDRVVEVYHQHKMREVLEKAEKEVDKEFNTSPSALIIGSNDHAKSGANWLLNHLKTKIKEG